MLVEQKIIYLPKDFTSTKISKVTKEIIDNNIQPKYKTVIFNFKELTYISPSGVALLDNLIGWLENNKVIVYISDVNERESKMCPIKFLRDTGFFEKYLDVEDKHSYLRIPEKSLDILPITNLTSNRYEEWSLKFERWYSSVLNVSAVEVASIVAVVKDLLNNVSDHAQIASCGIFAQYIRSQDKIYIAISDFGVGITTKVKEFLNDKKMDEIEALKWALEEGNSTKSTPHNRGVGLHILLENIVLNCDGKVEIFSNNAKISCAKNDNRIQLYTTAQEINYPGTMILIKLTKEKALLCLDEKEEFEW